MVNKTFHELLEAFKYSLGYQLVYLLFLYEYYYLMMTYFQFYMPVKLIILYAIRCYTDVYLHLFMNIII